MHIVVCIKQVPETGNVRMDEQTGTMVREGVETIINPLDLHAVEMALEWKEARGGRVTAVSMGPPNAEKAVREAIAMGCDAAVLLSHRALAGSDTYATSQALAAALRKLAPFDLVLTGVRATDGETGQVGPGVASLFGLPLATYTSRITAIEDGRVTVERLVETGYETLRLPLPCLLTIGKDAACPRLPTLRGKQRARQETVPVWGPAELGLDESTAGLAGSPTRVVRITRPSAVRKGRTVEAGHLGAAKAAREIADFLEERNLL
jgi:electron transfer flavoprotein beta subunit